MDQLHRLLQVVGRMRRVCHRTLFATTVDVAEIPLRRERERERERKREREAAGCGEASGNE